MALILTAQVNLALASTKDAVQERGYVQCGVSTGLPGFSRSDEQGNWSGLDVDVCRAVAAALLGDASKVKYIPLMAKERITALVSGKVDLLPGGVAWTLTRDSALGVHFTGVLLYDRRGVLVPQTHGAKKLKELEGMNVCHLSGSPARQNLLNDFQQRKLEPNLLAFDTADQLLRAFETGRCGAIVGGQTQLRGLQQRLQRPDDTVMLQEPLSNIAFGPIVRQGDDAWFNIVKWSLFALIDAEETGISSANIESMKKSHDPRIRRFLGLEGAMGGGLGLPDDWAYRIIKQVGNYGESFEKNLGMRSPLKTARGQNELWSKEGALFAPPLL